MRRSSCALGDKKGLGMRLLELDIKNFGKFHDRQIELQEGIHLICGENEAGKSTLHTFIRAMLFGLDRGRGRASAKDTFSRYEPWENQNYYAGNLRFECGGKIFCLKRRFDRYGKGAELICETDGEVLSVEDGDLEMILNGLTASSYENTLYAGEFHTAAGQALAGELKNYAANCYVSGDSGVNLKEAREALLGRKKEADREAKQSVTKKQRKREAIEQEAAHIWRDIHNLDAELEDVRTELELRRAEKAEDSAETGMENEWVKQRITDILRPAKWRIHPVEVIMILAAIVCAFLLLPNPWNDFVTVVVALLGAIYVWNRMKLGKSRREPEAIPEDVSQKELISTERLSWKLEHLSAERMEKQIEYDNIQEQLQEMDEAEDHYLELIRRREALVLAEERLEEVSASMQKQLLQSLNQKASEVLAEVTGGRYTRITMDEELNMNIFQNDRMIALHQASRGTAEQVCFALRMAAADILYEGPYPLILDDAFAFYDDARLAETLKWLAGCGRQVIIFSCQGREGRLLKRKGICYAKTVL